MNYLKLLVVIKVLAQRGNSFLISRFFKKFLNFSPTFDLFIVLYIFRTDMKPLPIFSEERLSDLFISCCFCDSSVVIDCEHCGRTLFDPTGQDMEEGELNKLLKKQKRHPQKYISVNGRVSWCRIEDKQTVVGCPCGKMAAYEEFIWDNRHLICGYLNQRASAELRVAAEIADLAAKAHEQVR